MDCIFCKIANKNIKTEFVYEDENVVAFSDIHPIAPVHILIIPKKHIESINDLESREIAASLLMAARKIAEVFNISENGYKFLIRNGRQGGQEVKHLHAHVIGGCELEEIIRPIS